MAERSTATDYLISVIQQLSLARDLNAITDIVRQAARKLTGADGATFVLREGPNCFYVDEDAIEPLWKGRRFPLEACISGWSMLNRTEAVIPDIYVDPRIPVEAYRPTFVKSLVMVPIRSAAPIGAIGNYWATPHTATPEEIHLLRALADSTSIAIENVQLYAERAATERLRALGSMAAGVTHDLKNMLNPLGLHLQLLRRTLTDASPDTRAVLDEMTESLKYGNEMLERMRLFIKRDAEPPTTPCELGEAAKNALEICRPRIRDNPKLDVAVEIGAPVPVQVRKSDLASALVNLVVNACEAMMAGGRITVRTGGAQGKAWVEVEDTGPGIPEDVRTQVLDEFFTTKETGTGLGLSIVSSFVQQAAGSIEIDSVVGRGTRIRLAFPTTTA